MLANPAKAGAEKSGWTRAMNQNSTLAIHPRYRCIITNARVSAGKIASPDNLCNSRPHVIVRNSGDVKVRICFEHVAVSAHRLRTKMLNAARMRCPSPQPIASDGSIPNPKELGHVVLLYSNLPMVSARDSEGKRSLVAP